MGESVCLLRAVGTPGPGVVQEPVARGFFQEVLVRRSTHGLLSVRDNLPTSGSGAGHIPAQHLGSL